MRITRDVSFKIQQSSRRLLSIVATSLFVLASSIVLNVTLHPVNHASAAATPESCFQFDNATGTILNYYDNENNDAAQPACPKDVEIPSAIGGIAVIKIGDLAFQSKQLTSVVFVDTNSVAEIGSSAFSFNQLSSLVVPNSVTVIRDGAFGYNQLTTLQLGNSISIIGSAAFISNRLTTLQVPDSVIAIENSAFQKNKLELVVLSNSLTTIDVYAFFDNHLTSAIIPDTLTSLSPCAFAGQTDVSFGQSFFAEMVSSDAARKAAAFRHLHYMQINTASADIQNGLVSDACVVSDELDLGDLNGDGMISPIAYAGHIINPAPVTVEYKDPLGNLMDNTPQSHMTGDINGSKIYDYLYNNGPVLPMPVDAYSPQPSEMQAIQDALGPYYSVGQTHTFAAPLSHYYDVAAPQTVTLLPGENIVSFIYRLKPPSRPNMNIVVGSSSDSLTVVWLQKKMQLNTLYDIGNYTAVIG